MSVIVLADPSSGSQAKILSELGFSLFHFSTHLNDTFVDVIDALPDFESGNVRASSCGTPILFPFPNRIANGKYHWDGKDYQLTDGKHAIHGFCFDRPWRVVEQNESSATGEFQLSVDAPDRVNLWPADFIIRCTYELQGHTLRSRFTFHNPDDKPLPWGFGTHAYFKVPLSSASSLTHCRVQVPVRKQWVLENFIPTGQMIDPAEEFQLSTGPYIEGLKLDHVFTDVIPSDETLDTVIIDEGASVKMIQACDPTFREVVVYTPPNRNAICMEPYTCPTDAVNLEATGIDCGWETLAPGESDGTWIDFRVEPLT